MFNQVFGYLQFNKVLKDILSLVNNVRKKHNVFCFNRKDVQENLRKEKQDFATMKRNCRATKQKNQKLEMELRQQSKKVISFM